MLCESPLSYDEGPMTIAEMDEASPLPTKRSTKEQRRMRLEKVGSYRVGKTLGRGNFAQVRMGYHETANAKVAIKIIDRQALDADNLIKIEREIRVLQKLKHPFIVKLYEVLRSEKNLYIVTEYVSGGELFDMLMDKGRQPEDEARRIFQQIVSAVAYCHVNGIVHRDLKAENLLLDKKGNVKLIDFGFSNYQKPDALLSTWCGSPPYAAPELLLAQEYNGTMSDVWSLGVVLYILVTAGFPFPGDSVDKLKRAVLGEHLKIPFWVSVECADLIRKMLTVSPAKRYTLTQVIQHRWFIAKMPDQIRDLLRDVGRPSLSPSSSSLCVVDGLKNGARQLDPTVVVFMQQHTGWTEEQIYEEVSAQNYESPIFATYELLNDKLAAFKDSEQLQLEDVARRGSRGSILSGKANVDPEPTATTIPAHHLAKLTLSASPEYDSDDSSASELGLSEESSPRYHNGGGPERGPRRRGRRGLYQDASTSEQNRSNEQRRHTLCAEQFPAVNPLLAAQQLGFDSTNAWAQANAAAAAALATMQLQQQRNLFQQHAQQAAVMNLAAFHNYPPIDYARTMRVPTQERRSSANEAMLGLNGYAHLLAACSTLGITAAADRNGAGPSAGPSIGHSVNQTVEEEGEHYLSQHGASKRNTVHALGITGFPATNPSFSSRLQRTPYAKQPGGERRSSWASSTATNALQISPQQQAQLERLYRQSVGGNPGSPGTAEYLNGVQQLQLEFQKLHACTREPSVPNQQQPQQQQPVQQSSNVPSPLMADCQLTAPTISITDENNRRLPSSSVSYDPLAYLHGPQPSDPQPAQPGSHQRPATVIGFSSMPTSGGVTTPTEAGPMSMTQNHVEAQKTNVKFYYIPVSAETALDRLRNFVASRSLPCEVQTGESQEVPVKARVANGDSTLLEMSLFRMPQSPNISKAEFVLIQGESAGFEELRTQLLTTFNEVC
ncbi:Protein KIN-29 [Aphelenchoides avenae]|nr:Protein KIN-29 [Aphelenchus avenae]